jgi:hypothetical protein
MKSAIAGVVLAGSLLLPQLSEGATALDSAADTQSSAVADLKKRNADKVELALRENSRPDGGIASTSQSADAVSDDFVVRVGAPAGATISANNDMLNEYVSLFRAELVYLDSNPELLAICGQKNPKREELRKSAIMLVRNIISTTPKNSEEANSAEHEALREQLFKIRKQLYKNGELGYVQAQEWGYQEQLRRVKFQGKSA